MAGNKLPENSNDDQNLFFIFNRDSFILIVNIISIGLMFGSVLNLVGYFFWEDTLASVLILSGILLLLGCFLQMLIRFKVRDKITGTSLIVISTLIIPLFSLKYIEIGSLTVWAIPFILIIISLVFVTPTMLFWVGLSALLTQIVVWIFAPSAPVVLVDDSDYILRIGFLMIALVAAYYINRLFVKKLRENAYYTKRIQELAYHDYLTDLPNRLLFNDRLYQAILSAKRTEQNLAVIFLDLDDFKRVNDAMGHEQGDVLLKEVARRLTETLREEDTVSRYGGDEFLVLAQNISTEAIEELPRRIIESMERPFNLEEHSVFITASLGVSVYPIHGETVNQLIKSADLAMYQAKEKGKNQYVLCSPE
ncbi:diguanylate cyclase (GGDEF) domain-containing protein [Desulfitobacterium dichloroeliminans LMG P-21439]|uniref:Diguanylate cyclase (GGDEF) domain-containing protein n=1 Tax=Desulfitobacterium dichloroeliminans (strain LMG P-21439 / DCA1) TaxID=871963 RepID=L0F710_DESDL|nr:GGDEF domain-containing protein [Desulfitobacterium dichloroeliminans]AGA68972.1 diguanylate cyclase (GGDEF) domain-containing protein [Desulfitobacterium dichloroeliminans LMG P-21439]